MNADKAHSLDQKIKTSWVALKTNEAELVGLLQEMNQIRGFLILGYASLWEYATKSLAMTESQASAYISVARKGMEVKILDQAVKSGELSVSRAKRITSVIHRANAEEWIKKAQTLSQRELDREKFRAIPQGHLDPEMRQSDRLLRMVLSVSEAFLKDLDDAQELMEVESREVALERILKDYLDKRDPVRKAERAAKRSGGSQIVGRTPIQATFLRNVESSHDRLGSDSLRGRTQKKIPSSVLHQIHLRDRGYCQYRLPNGRKCQSRRSLHIHHEIPRISGGVNSANNLRSLCAAHHRLHHQISELKLSIPAQINLPQLS